MGFFSTNKIKNIIPENTNKLIINNLPMNIKEIRINDKRILHYLQKYTFRYVKKVYFVYFCIKIYNTAIIIKFLISHRFIKN